VSRKILSLAVVVGVPIIIALQLVNLSATSTSSSVHADDAALLALLDDPQANGDPKLLAVGTLGASHVYTTYGYIGVMADAYAGISIDGEIHRIYTAERIAELTPVIVERCEECKARLEALRGELNEDDMAVADQMIEIYDLLAMQARALERFTKSNSPRDADEFEQLRMTVWTEIASLLHLDEE
jgi:hypothetical protein